MKDLPKWLKMRYAALWDTFSTKEFTREEAVRILEEKNRDDPRQVPAILSELRKNSFLQIRFDPQDARRSLYTLQGRPADLSTIVQRVTTGHITKQEVEGLLKRAADLIRTRVDYKFILILLFLKRISDKWQHEYDQAYKETLKDGLSEEEAREEAKSPAYHLFDLPEEFLWDNIRKDVNTLPARFSAALKSLGERNPELKDVVDRTDFIQFAANTENVEILHQLVELFSARKLHDVDADILGDAYEWILRYFAPSKAKEGEVYTPREVIKLLIQILDPQPGQSVYDPACGSGGMLIEAFKHVKEKSGREAAQRLFLFGQEVNQTTYALAKMNILIHDIVNAKLQNSDTLLYPKFKEGDSFHRFDLVIANPPWNQDGYSEETLKKGEFWRERFPFGFVSKQSADWAWIQHMLASSTQRLGIVIDNGCLFRGGKEKAIRSAALEKDLLECVILLPEKLFYNTGAAGAILILNKNKPPNRKGKILFINASHQFEKHPEIRKLNRLGDQHIQTIARAYHTFQEKDGFYRAVPLQEIKDNDYNLNVTLYVFPEEKEEDIDVKKEWQELKSLDSEINGLEVRIERHLEEIQ